MTAPGAERGSLLRQPLSMWATAFAALVAFMGIGLVDPILPAIAKGLNASPWQVELLFTSYITVMALAMLVTGLLSSRFGAKRTLIAGLLLVVVFATLSGRSTSIGMLAGMRAGWGLGNALFTATALTVIVGAASGGLSSAITLYEAALGLGIAIGPLVGATLGGMSWRYPFFGTATLMAIAALLVATLVRDVGTPGPKRSAKDVFEAYRDPALLSLACGCLFYSYGFFVLLAYTPLMLHLPAHDLGLIFCSWGVLVAIFSVFVAPRVRERWGPIHAALAVLVLLAADMLIVALVPLHVAVTFVILSGALLGTNNALFTSLAMEVSAVPRASASAGYNFLRWIGAAIAPVLSGFLAQVISPRVPFVLAAVLLVVSIAVLSTRRSIILRGLRQQEVRTSLRNLGFEQADDYLRDRRHRQGWSPEQMAQELGVTPHHIHGLLSTLEAAAALESAD
ncbi:MAG: MFS transporter [Chloroflexi bacterium]|nr:MFS transporter [Chloroflexota bacterium]